MIHTGDGQASRRICEAIEYYFGLRSDKPDKIIPTSQIMKDPNHEVGLDNQR